MKELAFTKLAQWYNEVENAGFKSFNTVSRTLQNHYTSILNFLTTVVPMPRLSHSLQKLKVLELNLEASQISNSSYLDCQKIILEIIAPQKFRLIRKIR
ncbi:transposase [Echinicola pacifica]|uniref:transposase n=1 Tax=Echinicola pacifica TaxID=346377 RepID=UPI001F0A7DFC|nr:transposase [Echinicola pacifica]